MESTNEYGKWAISAIGAVSLVFFTTRVFEIVANCKTVDKETDVFDKSIHETIDEPTDETIDETIDETTDETMDEITDETMDEMREYNRYKKEKSTHPLYNNEIPSSVNKNNDIEDINQEVDNKNNDADIMDDNELEEEFEKINCDNFLETESYRNSSWY